MNGGLELNPGQPINVNAPTGWSGRFWGRTGCFFDQSGKGYCATGNCGGGVAECAGAGGEPPATLAEFTLNSPLDFYDISLVDGFNIPVSVVPTGGSGDCKSAQCLSDLNQNCPHGLQVRRNGRVVACKSARVWLSTSLSIAALVLIIIPTLASLQITQECSRILAQQLIAMRTTIRRAFLPAKELIT
ncbi:pathogenesis-related thaumatin superfamily protein [Actinidia rufa]|uniref:Pathogenesis-related thaumatin superfamily protein n=1 Tax=Actinidia rufa TaxID=165716 RepID=A0A7J0FXY1_9ERIC|nr:pathogenesis-related thaumatin superfamily protein [Actinidia rufa]